MTSGLLPVDPALAEAAADGENRAATETDPILLLAAMGLNLQPEASVDSTDPEAGTDGGDMLLTDGGDMMPTNGGDMLSTDARYARLTADSTATKPETTLVDALKAAGRKTDDDAPRGTVLPQATGAAAGNAAAATANFAGFEQKLAETLQLQGNGEGTTQPTTGLATTQTAAQRPAAEVQQQHIASPLRSQAWPAEFSQKIVWMASQDKQSAQLTLNPSQMGPIEISLSIRNDQASAVFASGNAEV
ncbi:MAG: flagellar hook-length control protein FliK, partial [Azospira sp.]|nr:flagellar hook-length control protein FliK [Azospira sp.]